MADFLDRHRVYVVIESTRGVDPDVGVGSMVPLPIESPESTFTPSFRQRGAIGAAGPGSPDVQTAIQYGFKGKMALYPVTVTGNTSRPLGYELLRACGCDIPVYTTPTGFKVITLRRVQAANPLTLTIYHYTADDSGDAWLTKRHGCQGNMVVKWSAKEGVYIEFDLVASSGSEEAAAMPSAPTYKDSNNDTREPLSGVSAEITDLATFDDSDTYEGMMTSGQVDWGMDSASLQGIPVGANGWSGRTRSTTARTPFSCTIQMTDDFSPRDLLARSFKLLPLFTAIDLGGTDTVQLPIYPQLQDAQRSYDTGFGMWTLSGLALWNPPSGGDPGTTEGYTSALVFKSPT